MMKKIYVFLMAAILGILITTNVFSQTMVDVTFRVDMQEQTVSPNGVHVAGSFPAPYPEWNPAGIQLDPPPLGTVYSTTLSLEVGTTIEYKFVNGNVWGDDEAVPPCCAQNNNRYFTVTGTEVLPAICYGSCNPCNSSPTLRDITFQVDLSDVTYTTGAYIAGNLQDPQWTPEPMMDMGNNIFQITIALEEEGCYQYKYVLDGSGWETVPDECKSFEGNRFLEVPAFDQTLDLVCFGGCVGCNPVDVTFSVDMTNETLLGDVYVAGSFNGWNTTANPLTDMGSNIWETTITLQNGQDVEYKFINGVDGWEVVPAACSWGDGNRHFIVPENPLPLDLVCFGACNPCSPTNTAEVIFSVDMSSQLVSGDVFLAGDFNDWSMDANPMIDMGNNIYEVTVSLGEGFIYGYKFINGTNWEIVPAECNYNEVRTVVGPAVNTPLPTVCFNECGECTTTLYRFNLSVNLEGFYNGTDMNTTLFDDGLLPSDQPYSGPPWNYPGTEQLTALPDVPVVDWVYIQFRETVGDASTATGATMIDHQAALLLADGTIARPDGSPGIYWNGAITDNLYVVIFHRNHLSVMTATPVIGIADIFPYNFTDVQSKAYLNGQTDLGGEFGMFAGDINGDGIIDATDIVEWGNHAGHAGYNSSDADADTQINNLDKNDVWVINLNVETQVPE